MIEIRVSELHPVARHDKPGAKSHARRMLAASLPALLSAVGLLITPAIANADNSSSLTVIGTSDVSDSGLMTNVIQPAFQKAYPQYTFKYIGTATGTAISGAESGAQGASALIVHAASLENQFVAGGYSYEQYGRAIFTNDFVLAGDKPDPAGVAANAPHNIAQAFADVAAAGINGRATFVSRGGTPGTTVQEHQIWQLVDKSGLAPAGLLLCAVNAATGGGETPIASGNGVTASGQACPNNGALPSGGQLPQWYAVIGLTQGPNVQNANACNGYPSGPNSCYVMSDRGTYDYLASGTDPAGSTPNLTIVTRNDSASAPGGAYELINYFHAYIINPSKPNESVNLTAAQAFLNLLTSQSLQAQLKSYLATSDPGGAPFVADASPNITAIGIPHHYRAGRPVRVTGTVTNAQPGYPAIAGKPVSVDEVVGALSIPVASGKTNSTGGYSIRFVPPTNGSYEVVTPQIAQVENASLTPVFGDLLSPAATTPVKVTVYSTTENFRVRSEGASALVTGSVAPGTGHVKGTITVLAGPAGSKRGLRRVAMARLAPGEANFAILLPLAAGRWQLKLSYRDPRQVVASSTRTVSVTIGSPPAMTVNWRSTRLKHGSLTLAAALTAAPSGGKVELLAMNTAPGAPARFRVLRTAGIGAGKTKFTLHARLKRSVRWVLQLEYVPTGQASTFSGLRTANVG
jgi:ABC-type tungstate transport system permease subunit